MNKTINDIIIDDFQEFDSGSEMHIEYIERKCLTDNEDMPLELEDEDAVKILNFCLVGPEGGGWAQMSFKATPKDIENLADVLYQMSRNLKAFEANKQKK